MGYTHYWSFKKFKGEAKAQEAAYQTAIKQCAKIVKTYYKAAGGISGYTAHTAIGQYGGLEVNGKGEESHETFAMPEHFGETDFEFCKTARKPYDVVVTACLATMKHYLGYGINVSSDGRRDDWWEGVTLANRVLGVKIDNPISERD